MKKCTLNNKELADKVSAEIIEFCKTGGKSFTMHVPARLNENLDLIVSEMVNRFRDLTEAKPPDASANTLPIQNISWVATKDELPPMRKQVLGYNGYVMIEVSWEKYTGNNEKWFKENFTHWAVVEPPCL